MQKKKQERAGVSGCIGFLLHTAYCILFTLDIGNRMATFSGMKTTLHKKGINPPHGVNRRDFLKYSAVTGGALYLGL